MNIYKIYKVLKIFSILFFSLHLSGQGAYKIVLKTDFDGNVVEGSKEELIRLIREGNPVRIGWQLDFDEDKQADFDHWMDAEFITILKNDVFTQIRNINAQIPNDQIPQIKIIPNNLMWTAILGTNSKLLNRFVYDDIEYTLDSLGQAIMDEKTLQEIEIRKISTWNVATFWAVPK